MHNFSSSSSSPLFALLLLLLAVLPPLSASAQQQQQQQQNCLVDMQPSNTDDPTRYYPWMAAILKVNNADGSTEYVCTGSIISANFVLTAAHCIQDMVKLPHVVAQPHERIVHVGSADKTGGRKFAVAEVIAHPNSLAIDSPNSIPCLNDIGLLKLKTPIEFDNQNTAPICLGGNFVMEELALAAGWGGQMPHETCGDLWKVVEQTQENGLRLQSGKVRIVPFSSGQCRLYPYSPADGGGAVAEEKQICTMPHDGTLVESGDSGGPLVKYDPVQGWHQLGVASYGNCSMPQSPVIYTKVDAYCEWIAQVTGNEARCNPPVNERNLTDME